MYIFKLEHPFSGIEQKRVPELWVQMELIPYPFNLKLEALEL